MKIIISAFLILCTSIAVVGQDLSTEVVVDRTVEPQYRPVTRPSDIYPRVILPYPDAYKLPSFSYTGLSEIDPYQALLPVASRPLTPELNKYRGYAALGYFPVADFGIRAGYKALQTKTMSLNIFADAFNEKYKVKDADYKQTYANIQGVFGWDVNEFSTLKASAAGQYHRQSTYLWAPQNLLQGQISASWRSKPSKIEYGISADAHFERTTADDRQKALTQQVYNFKADFTVPIGNRGWAYSTEAFADIQNTPRDEMGLIGLTPAIRYKRHNLDVKLGLLVEYDYGGWDNVLHIKPDLSVNWAPLNWLGLRASWTGGGKLNDFRTMRQFSPFCHFTEAMDYSDIRGQVDFALRLGPFKGFAAEFFGGFAAAYDWQMMSLPAQKFANYGWEDRYIDGHRLGLKFEYIWGRYSAVLSGETAPGELGKAWLANRDRARQILFAKIQGKPIDKLNVALSYTLRANRNAFGFVYTPQGYTTLRQSLGNISDLSIEAGWKLTPQWGLALQLSNLLCRHWQILPDIYQRSISGLISANYSF